MRDRLTEAWLRKEAEDAKTSEASGFKTPSSDFCTLLTQRPIMKV